jgi:hypothetical protein
MYEVKNYNFWSPSIERRNPGMFPWKNFDKLTYPALERKPNTEQNHLYSQKKEYKRPGWVPFPTLFSKCYKNPTFYAFKLRL